MPPSYNADKRRSGPHSWEQVENVSTTYKGHRSEQDTNAISGDGTAEVPGDGRWGLHVTEGEGSSAAPAPSVYSFYLGVPAHLDKPSSVRQKIFSLCSDPFGSLITNSLPSRISASMYS